MVTGDVIRLLACH